MLKLLGAILLTGGATGYSLCVCRDLKKRLAILKEIKYMYQLIQSEICYTALPMLLIFENISEKIKQPLGRMLKDMVKSAGTDQGKTLTEIWSQEAGDIISKMPLTKEQKASVVGFTESLGMIDKEGQARALQRKIEELENWIVHQEKEGSQQQKLIMSIGIAGGLFLVIMLV